MGSCAVQSTVDEINEKKRLRRLKKDPLLKVIVWLVSIGWDWHEFTVTKVYRAIWRGKHFQHTTQHPYSFCLFSANAPWLKRSSSNEMMMMMKTHMILAMIGLGLRTIQGGLLEQRNLLYLCLQPLLQRNLLPLVQLTAPLPLHRRPQLQPVNYPFQLQSVLVGISYIVSCNNEFLMYVSGLHFFLQCMAHLLRFQK